MTPSTVEEFYQSDIMTPEETAQYLRKSLSWVYKNWRLLGGGKLRGSLFFSRRLIHEHIFGEGQRWRFDFTLKGKRYTAAWFKTKTEAKQAEARKKRGPKTAVGTSDDRNDNGADRHGLFHAGK